MSDRIGRNRDAICRQIQVSTTIPNDIDPEENGRSKTRLDQELDEILAKSGAEQLKPPRRQIQRPALRSMPGGLSVDRPTRLRRVPTAGLLMISSIVVAFVAMLVADASPLLARLLVYVAIGCFIAPIVMHFWPSSGGRPEQKMWRGRVIEYEPERPSVQGQLRRWWQNRSTR